MNMGMYLRELRQRQNLSQRMLAQRSGISNATISRLEAGTVNPDTKTLYALAQALCIDASLLLEAWNSEERDTNIALRRIPVLGNVIAGIPLEAVEEVLGYEDISADMAESGSYFGLRIKGDSMEPRICEGDIVIVRQQDDVESGKIAIVLVENENATVKKLLKHENGISLVSFNQRYSPMFFTWQDVENLPVKVLGEVVELRSRF